MQDIKRWAWEATKEGLRVFVVTALPILIIQVENDNLNLRALFIAGIAGILKAIDKALYLYQKETDTQGAYKGLIGF